MRPVRPTSIIDSEGQQPGRDVADILLRFEHLAHALQSAIKTFGFSHPGYCKLAEKGSIALAVVLAAGFAVFPIYFFFN